MPGGVGDDLAKVVMVGDFQLVFDHNQVFLLFFASHQFCEDIGAVAAHRAFGGDQFQLHAEDFADQGKPGTRQPGGEIAGFVLPDCAQRQWFNRS